MSVPLLDWVSVNLCTSVCIFCLLSEHPANHEWLLGSWNVCWSKKMCCCLSFLCHHCFQNFINPMKYFPKIRPWKFVKKINIYIVKKEKECAHHCRVAFLCPVCIPIFLIFNTDLCKTFSLFFFFWLVCLFAFSS